MLVLKDADGGCAVRILDHVLKALRRHRLDNRAQH